MKASLTDTVSPASSPPSQMHHQNLPSTPTINRNVHSSIESEEIYSSGGGRVIKTGGSIRYSSSRRNSRRRRPLYRQTTKVDTKLRKLHNLSAVRWLDRNATSVTVNGKIYTLKKSEQPVAVPVYYYRCGNNPETSTKVNGKCYHLEDCVLKLITKKKNKLKYASRYFCPLEDEDGEQFAGICCPDGAWI